MITPGTISLSKFYRMRNGEKARIICIDANNNCPIISIRGSYVEDAHWHRPDGTTFLASKGPFDLVEEWVEPSAKKRVWLWEFRNADGTWILRNKWQEKPPRTEGIEWRKSPLCPDGIEE